MIRTLILTALLALASPADAAQPYPQPAKSIPTRFQGAWDELINDGCRDREARYLLKSQYAMDFEVLWHVKRVTLTGRNSIDILLKSDPAFGDPQQTTWSFRLVDNDKGLVEPGSKLIYRRCPRQRR